MKGNTAGETHFNVKIVSPKFDGLNLVKRHRLVYDALAEELQSGLHALSIVAKTPQEEGAAAKKYLEGLLKAAGEQRNALDCHSKYLIHDLILSFKLNHI
ncbi:hypothetical protein NC651_027764 [Populus alba x Populus x berolinensis]|nr:hypothetical protein NC651_027764 [Populus alba x Populus x berolinensis]